LEARDLDSEKQMRKKMSTVRSLTKILVPFRCMLHNFGGNLEMYGRLDVVGAGPIEALTSPNSTMVVSLNF
jgi:hypothetical protein